MSERPFPWRTALFVSLAANLLVVGAVGGALWAGVRIERGARETAERMPGGLLASMPDDLRRLLRQQMAGDVDRRDALREASQQARIEAYEAAAAEPYDSARVRAAFARVREADQAAIGAVHDDFAEALAVLPEPQRREALESWRRAPRGWRAQRERAGPTEAAPLPGERLQERRERRAQRRARLRQERENRPRENPAAQP